MKKIYFLVSLALTSFVFAQTTIYTENFGNPAATTPVTTYTGFQATAPVAYAGTSDVRTSTPSTGYTGASGQGCVFIAGTTTASGNPLKEIIISGIDTDDYENLILSFGHQKGTNVSSNELLVSVSSDGSTWTPLTYTRPTGTGTSTWLLVTPTGTIPSTPTLSIKFSNPLDSNVGFRIDDVKLVGTAIVLGTSAVNKNKFNVFPTVVNNGTFFVTSDSNATKNVKIYDQTSKLVINTKTVKEVNVSQLTKGIYIVTVEENGVVETKKVVIK